MFPMSDATVLDRVATVNGTARRPARKPKADGKPRPGARHTAMRQARQLATACGSVATAVLALSVVHCTQAIAGLTGSHWLLAALLAIGIDAGMVASELAEVASHGTSAEHTVGRWARGYTLAAIVLSMLLNGYAFGQHAAGALTYAAAALGAIIPALVYGLGRVAAHLWRAGE
jgi:hypothetical protein